MPSAACSARADVPAAGLPPGATRCRVWLFDGGPGQRRWPREERLRLMQQCVAEAAGVDAADVRIGRTPSGQPVVQGPSCAAGLAISASDTSRHLAIAVQACVHLGIDIEPRAGRTVSQEPLPWLSPTEAAAIAGAPDAHRREHFLGVWTQKEAYLKALGLGLGLGGPGLASFEVETAPRAPACLRRAPAGMPALHLHRLEGDGWVGALACDAAGTGIEWRTCGFGP